MRTAFLIFLGVWIFLYSPAADGSADARHWEQLSANRIRCLLCPRACLLAPGQTGTCRVRRNTAGRLESLVYGRPCSLHVDPIEKKPLYHFLPGSASFSVATPGCNLRCVFCQNWQISQAAPADVHTVSLTPLELARQARTRDCASLAYTYSEPTVFFEYMYDTAVHARQQGLRNVWITSGYINPQPLEELCAVIDAAHVDLKGFSDRAYGRIASVRRAPVLATLKILRQKGVWFEVGYLVIPTINDTPAEITELTSWMMKNLGPDVPLHFLRFFPQHKLTSLPPTPVATLETAYAIAKKSGLRYVYIGNVPGHAANNTYCPACGRMVIERKGCFLQSLNINNGRCAWCGSTIAGVWQ